MSPVLRIIEETYEMGLNPELPYAAQLETLGSSGELSNGPKLRHILFSLCELVDKQARQIKGLTEDNRTLTLAFTDLEKKLPLPTYAASSNSTQPNTNNTI